jgi:hypothetical protein
MATSTAGTTNSAKVTIGRDASGCWGCGGYRREGEKINSWCCWGVGGYVADSDKSTNVMCWGCGYKKTTMSEGKVSTDQGLCCHPFGFHYSNSINNRSKTCLTCGGIFSYFSCKSNINDNFGIASPFCFYCKNNKDKAVRGCVTCGGILSYFSCNEGGGDTSSGYWSPFGWHCASNEGGAKTSQTCLTLGGAFTHYTCKSHGSEEKFTLCGPCFVKKEEKHSVGGVFSSLMAVTLGFFNYWKYDEKLSTTSPATESKCVSCLPVFCSKDDKDSSNKIITTGLCNVCSFKDKKTGSTCKFNSVLPFYSHCGDEKTHTSCCTTGVYTHSKGSNDGKPVETRCGSWGLGCSCYQKEGDKSGKCSLCLCLATPICCMYCRSGRCCVQERGCFSNFPSDPCAAALYVPCLCCCCHSKHGVNDNDCCCCNCCGGDICCACLATYKDIGIVDKSDIQSTTYSCVPCGDVERIPEIVEGVEGVAPINANAYQASSDHSSKTVAEPLFSSSDVATVMPSAIAMPPMSQTMGSTPTTITYRTAVHCALLQTEDFAEFRRTMGGRR